MPPRKEIAHYEPPSLRPEQAIALIKRQLDRLNDIEQLVYNDPKIDAWESTTRDVLDRTYGKPSSESHRKTKDVMHAPSGPMRIGMSSGEMQPNHRTRFANRRALLEAYVEQLQDGLAPPVLSAPNYSLHPEIEKVSFQLMQDAHFKSAALEAYIRVIEEVKRRSGLALEGDNLMNHAFGRENRVPPLAFNSLTTDSERDEQKGIMFLFKGVVSLRNAKAHSNSLFDDPSRAHEYLALASLLMRLLEIANKHVES